MAARDATPKQSSARDDSAPDDKLRQIVRKFHPGKQYPSPLSDRYGGEAFEYGALPADGGFKILVKGMSL